MSDDPFVLGLIWAQARGGVIGDAGGMPWHVPEDLEHFKELTWGYPVIMGRRTWESLPAQARPLPGRRNFVLTCDADRVAEGAEVTPSLDSALALLQGEPQIWVIGGGQLFAQAIHRATVLEVTELDIAVDGDTRAPSLDGWAAVRRNPEEGWHRSRSGIPYRFSRFLRDRRHGG